MLIVVIILKFFFFFKKNKKFEKIRNFEKRKKFLSTSENFWIIIQYF